MCAGTELTFVPFIFDNCSSPLLEIITFGPFSISKLQGHVMIFSLFASTIGPFGGFFASGLKRSVKIKVFLNKFRILETPSLDMEESSIE